MTRQYPTHIYDPQRIEIATGLIQHEFRHLFQSIPEALWPALDRDIAGWFDGDKYDLAPAHDFWNATDAIMRGFKLKGVVKYITAENATWRLADVPVIDIDISWKLPPLAPLGDPPYDTRELKKRIATDPQLYRNLTINSDFHAATTVPRDHYPVLLLSNGGRIKIADGNRRVLRALLHDRRTIRAWQAEWPADQPLRNYWVSTAFLRELGEQALVAQAANNQPVLTSLRELIHSLFEQSTIARTNFDLRVKDKYSLLEF